MTLYCVSIGNKQYQVNIGKDQVTLDGEPFDIHLIPLNGNGLHLLRRGNLASEVYLQNTDGSNYEVLAGGQRIVARVEEASRKPHNPVETVQTGEMSAPMPGLVVDVLVKEGDKVETGQALIVLESMKMQMQMRAPIDGVVKGVYVKVGDQLEKGTLLVRI
jgi:biotin carboxyl carrier protein